MLVIKKKKSFSFWKKFQLTRCNLLRPSVEVGIKGGIVVPSIVGVISVLLSVSVDDGIIIYH